MKIVQYLAFVLFLAVILFIPHDIVLASSVSPKEFGYMEAKTGEERYMALYNTHSYAFTNNKQVSYSGIEYIYLSIPKGAKSIPLCDKTDFCGASFIVYNDVRDNFPLFELKGSLNGCSVSVDDNGNFSIDSNIEKRNVVLVLTDNKPWVAERHGFGYNAIRKDILYVKNGRSKNSTIAPYFKTSNVNAEYFIPNIKRQYFRNITFIRDARSSKKTLLINVENIYNLEISKVKVTTPVNDSLYGDAIITIRNGVKIKFKDIQVDNTYSFEDKYGYAFVLNNVANFEANNIKAIGKWGVFCCNNLNTSKVSSSTINRFDIHCYGKDFSFNTCSFTKTGIPMSSFYGRANFKKCTFDNAIPIIYRADYNAYTFFELSFSNCIFKFDDRHNYLVDLARIPKEANSREELSEKYLPNITIDNCSFILESGASQVSIIKGGINADGILFNGFNRIDISRVDANIDGCDLFLFDSPIIREKDVNIHYDGSLLEMTNKDNKNRVFKIELN